MKEERLKILLENAISLIEEQIGSECNADYLKINVGFTTKELKELNLYIADLNLEELEEKSIKDNKKKNIEFAEFKVTEEMKKDKDFNFAFFVCEMTKANYVNEDSLIFLDEERNLVSSVNEAHYFKMKYGYDEDVIFLGEQEGVKWKITKI